MKISVRPLLWLLITRIAAIWSMGLVTYTLAQQPVITSFESDGTLAWSSAYPDGIASIERLTDVSTTGSAVTVTETIGISDGSTVVYNHTVEHPPIVNPSVTISDGTYSWDDEILSSSPADFAGVVSSYEVGMVSAVYLTAPPSPGSVIEVEYSYLPLSVHQEWQSVYTELSTGAVCQATVDTALRAGIFRVLSGPSSLSEYMVIDLSGGSDALSYPISFLPSAPSGGWTDEYMTTQFLMRRIPAGTFMMGSPTSDAEHSQQETPQHQVTLTKDFYIGVYEVTQEQWYRVMGDWPSYFHNPTYRASRPVERVSYDDIRGSSIGTGWPRSAAVDALSFMGRLRAKTGLPSMDLPTEAQWEYACRAGTTTRLNNGDDLSGMDEVGRHFYNGGRWESADGDTTVGSAWVGSYLPNAWGLYDMHGNVREWCLDWRRTYSGAVVDPLGATSGSFRANRGGSWDYAQDGCRSAERIWDNPSSPNWDWSIGLRAAMTLP